VLDAEDRLARVAGRIDQEDVARLDPRRAPWQSGQGLALW
jgi:hypothetical protein